MDSAGREHDEYTSRNDLNSSKLTPQDNSPGQHENPEQTQQLTGELRDCDWEQLEEKYAKAMEYHGKSEEELRAQVAKLLEVIQFCSSYQGHVSDCPIAGLCSMVSDHRPA